MSKLADVIARLVRVQGRKKSRYRAYQSEVLNLKLQLVQREPARPQRRSSER